MIFRNKKQSKGFTILEMIVSTTIIVLMLSFVLASFRAARYSGELDVVLQQAINGISTVRVKGVSGNLVEYPVGSGDRVYPSNGYVMKMTAVSDSFDLYGLHGVEEVDVDEITFQGIVFEDLCSFDDLSVSIPVCGNDWSTHIEIEAIFDLSGDVRFRDSFGDLTAEYIGGILTHQKTNKKAYFYVPAATGIAIGDLID